MLKKLCFFFFAFLLPIPMSAIASATAEPALSINKEYEQYGIFFVVAFLKKQPSIKGNAQGETRTRTTVKSQDFKSCVSTNSTTRAHAWLRIFKLTSYVHNLDTLVIYARVLSEMLKKRCFFLIAFLLPIPPLGYIIDCVYFNKPCVPTTWQAEQCSLSPVIRFSEGGELPIPSI